MSKIDLTKYGITGTTEIVYNPSYETLFEEETNPNLEGFDKGQVSELGAAFYHGSGMAGSLCYKHVHPADSRRA